MVKKLISDVLAAGLLITAFTASNSSNGKNASTISQQVSSTAEPTKAEPVKIKLSHQQGKWIWPILTELTKQWQDKTGSSVELVYAPEEGSDKWRQTQFLAGTEPDIVWIGGGKQIEIDGYAKN